MFHLALNVVASPIYKRGNYSSIVIDSNGNVLWKKSEKKLIYPASLVKVMTLYIIFDKLSTGKISLHEKFFVSKYATKQPIIRLGLKVGEYITVEEAIHALIIRSANDVAVVVAENISGNCDEFVALMNKTAKKLKMKHTTFCNPNGLPDPKQLTTAYDLALLTLALYKKHNKYFRLFSKVNFKYRGKVINSHNKLIKRYSWIDGIKTGFICDSGYNIISSARKFGKRFIGVVSGGRNTTERDDHMLALFNTSFKRKRENIFGNTFKVKRNIFGEEYVKKYR